MEQELFGQRHRKTRTSPTTASLKCGGCPETGGDSHMRMECTVEVQLATLMTCMEEYRKDRGHQAFIFGGEKRPFSW